MGVVVVKVQSCFAVPCPHLSWKKECIRNIHNYPLTFHKCMYKRNRRNRQNTGRNCGKDEIVVRVQANLLVYWKGIKTHARCNDIPCSISGLLTAHWPQLYPSDSRHAYIPSHVFCLTPVWGTENFVTLASCVRRQGQERGACDMQQSVAEFSVLGTSEHHPEEGSCRNSWSSCAEYHTRIISM
jgi:hypothetical protein